MTVRSTLRGIVHKLRSHGRKVDESRAGLADSLSSDNVLLPIPPDKPRPSASRRRGACSIARPGRAAAATLHP
jgi:hypothetical protein